MKKSPLKAVTEIVDRTRDVLMESENPTARRVFDVVVKEHPTLVADYYRELGEAGLLDIIAARMKKAVEARTAQAQLRLPFEMDEVPAAITYRESAKDGSVEFHYVRLSRATDEHLEDYENFLEDQIAADTARLHSVRTMRRALRPIFTTHPGITVGEACRLYEEMAAV